MVKCAKRQIRQLKTALHWKMPEAQRQRIQMILLRESGMAQPAIADAMGVVKCQLALAWLALRSCSQAAISSMRVCLSGMRRSRHWDDRTPSSDSARSSQLPCFGV